MKRVLLLLTALPLFAAAPAPVQQASDAFSGNAIRGHLKFMASDLLEGRGPGTRGDALAVNYIAAQFESYGLAPAGDDGSYLQKVPLLGITLEQEKTSISFTRPDGPPIGPLEFLDEWVGADQSQNTTATLDSEMIFVGHGIVAPEYRWDDYKGLDVRGKTLIMLADDPPATQSEPNLFGGRARTYHGRWTYKYEIGAAKGAQAVILIHTQTAAGYGWQVVRNSWGHERSRMKLAPGEPSLQLAGWITESVARNLFTSAGFNLDVLTSSAARRDFKPVSLGGFRLKGNITTTIRPFESHNVVARLEGSDPKLKEEAILYTAHHDHLGISAPDKTGDRIYNGAVDNASGTALLIEFARVWSQTRPAPKRSILFAAVAAEEQGLLGSEYYGKNPTIPAAKIALGLNFDAIYLFGPVHNVTMTGLEQTTFNPTAQSVAKEMGLVIVPDENPEQGSYYRSDHFSLARVGVPAFSVKQGHDIIGKPEGFGRERATEYRRDRYHQAADEFDPSWDFQSAVQMGQFGFWLGWKAANAATSPEWLPGAEFKSVRDRSIAASQAK